MWPQAVAALLGAWLMAAPAVLDYGGAAAVSDRIAGPLVLSFGIIALWPVTRAIGRLHLLAAAWLVLAPWLLDYPAAAAVSSLFTGGLLAGLSSVRSRGAEPLAGGWRAVWRG